MKLYEKPEFELISLNETDIICTSGDPNYEYGGTGDDENTGDNGVMVPYSLFD